MQVLSIQASIPSIADHPPQLHWDWWRLRQKVFPTTLNVLLHDLTLGAQYMQYRFLLRSLMLSNNFWIGFWFWEDELKKVVCGFFLEKMVCCWMCKTVLQKWGHASLVWSSTSFLANGWIRTETEPRFSIVNDNMRAIDSWGHHI